MKIKLLIVILLASACFKTSYAIHTRSQREAFDVKEGWATYYHVTRQENLKSIRKEGLLTLYGGTKNVRGMSALKNDSTYLKESMNYVHFGVPWEAATRYAQHMLKLVEGNLGPYEDIRTKDMPVVLKCDAYQGTFTKDPHDKEAIRTKIDVPVSNVFILVTRQCIDNQGSYTSSEIDEDEKSFWVPLKNWDARLQKPAYPNKDNNILQLDEHTIHQLLTKRIELYSRYKLNKGDAAREIGVCSKTLDKFLCKDLSLRQSTKQRIINSFCRHFSSITRFDYHFIKREVN
ncbi:MAG: hypothetical protein Q8S21_06130 [Candidatus Paracaedibacteraceae bacterium]|nr:hypothetical protein [Candidatus Paracaedibacteraceae bacterium]